MALISCLALAACGEPSRPAPVLNFGLHADSPTGAMIVEGQDTLWNIAKRYRLPVRDIIELNNLEPPYALAQGQRLKLPMPVDYRVKEGDTLYSIANMFGVGISGLVKVNRLPAPYAVRPGQDLRIPSTHQNVVQSEPPEPMISVAVPRVEREVIAAQQLSAPPGQARGVVPLPVTTLSTPKNSKFMWPVRGKVISGFGAKEGGLFNDGINIAVPRGTPVASAADGVIAYVGNGLKGYGNLVLIRHGGGTMTAYAHLASIRVKKGMQVRRGQVIGAVGSTGSVPSAQLHFEIRRGLKAFDPKQYMG